MSLAATDNQEEKVYQPQWNLNACHEQPSCNPCATATALWREAAAGVETRVTAVAGILVRSRHLAVLKLLHSVVDVLQHMSALEDTCCMLVLLTQVLL